MNEQQLNWLAVFSVLSQKFPDSLNQKTSGPHSRTSQGESSC